VFVRITERSSSLGDLSYSKLWYFLEGNFVPVGDYIRDSLWRSRHDLHRQRKRRTHEERTKINSAAALAPKCVIINWPHAAGLNTSLRRYRCCVRPSVCLSVHLGGAQYVWLVGRHYLSQITADGSSSSARTVTRRSVHLLWCYSLTIRAIMPASEKYAKAENTCVYSIIMTCFKSYTSPVSSDAVCAGP